MKDLKIKGTLYIGCKSFFETYKETELFEKVMSERMPGWTGKILPSSWYPAEVVLELVSLYAAKRNISFSESTSVMAEYGLERDLNGIYKIFMQLGGISRVLNSVPQLVTAYLNFLTMKVIENKTGYYKAQLDVPLIMTEYEVYSHHGGIKGILKVFKLKMTAFNIVSQEQYSVDGVTYIKTVYELYYE